MYTPHMHVSMTLLVPALQEALKATSSCLPVLQMAVGPTTDFSPSAVGGPWGRLLMSRVTALFPVSVEDVYSTQMVSLFLSPNHVMNALLQCILEPTSDVCGNGIVEGNEECDCGSSDAEECFQRDPCCTPGNCTLKAGALCRYV